MRLTTVAALGIGYVLGTRAGRERYDQLRTLVRSASGRLDQPSTRENLESASAWLESYARRHRHGSNGSGGVTRTAHG
jgi:hypothetical protein